MTSAASDLSVEGKVSLLDAILRIARSEDAAALRRATLGAVLALTGAERARLLIREGDRLRCYDESGDAEAGETAGDVGPGPRAIRDRRTVRVSGSSGSEPGPAGEVVAAPLRSADPIGALEASWPLRRARREELAIVACLAEVAGDALVSGRLVAERTHGERLYQAVVEDQTELIVRWKPGGVRTFVNEAYCRAFAGMQASFIGTSFLELVSPEDRRAVEEKIARLTPAQPAATDIHKVRLPGGEVGFQEWTDRALFDEQGRLIEYQSVGRDVTERVRLHEQLHRSRSHETVARLVAGVAHDVNNLLTPILSNLELLRLRRGHSGEPSDRIDDMHTAASAVAQLLRRLLAFGKTALDATLVPVSLGATVEEHRPLIRSVLGSSVALSIDVRRDATVRANAGLIGQLLLNLASNARDVQPQGGRFDITLDRTPGADDAELAVIACEDGGPGIPPAQAARVFDPYFTTKGTRGTGLGLANVQAVALDLGGDVRLTPAARGGSRFEILLPVWNGTEKD